MTIEERLTFFKTDIKKGILNAEEIFQKYFVDGITYYFQRNDVLAPYKLDSFFQRV